MKFDAPEALSEGFERFTTQAAAIVVGLYAVASIVQTAALQDVIREVIEELQEAARDELEPEEYQDFVDATDPILEDLPLALGLDLGPAIALFLVALLAATAIVALAIDAFARRATDADDLDTSGIVVHTLNIFVGGFIFFVLLVIGLSLFLLPGLVVLVLLTFYPVAIVVEDENFLAAFGSSIGTVTDNIGHTLLLLLLAFVIGVAGGVLSSVLSVVASGTVGGVLSTTVTAASTMLVLAMVTRAYVAANPDANRAVADTVDGESDSETW